MRNQRRSRVIIDTNIWISFLIGKELGNLKEWITSQKIQLIITDQLVNEIRLVSAREKLRKYFEPQKTEDLIVLLKIIAEQFSNLEIKPICRDPKDDFLLALAVQGKADFLVTSDKDLLEIKKISQTRIVDVKQFQELLK
jgi:uncharacterized protein